jgi:putative protease
MSQTDQGRQATRVELLSPAGDWDCAAAAVENGADAIYFGLDCGFNARFRAKNFGVADLPELTKFLRQRGVRGYVTLNTLVFPSEMPHLVDVVTQIAEAGIDAVLVQDFGVAQIVRAVCADLEIHASTQMSLTSAETIAVAAELGLSRVVLPRELSVAEIRKIAGATEIPLEVFIHGALCVAYSGQCLTSESLGGRSANRGQCAQACRLPYELICDGEDRDLGDVKYLLSPQDLAGYAAIPDLVDAGVASLKIEGRLKTPEYVANITGHYRAAIDQAMRTGTVSVDEQSQREMELSFSRGFSPGWLEGNDHKRLVPGLQSAKRGIELGDVIDVDGERIQLRIAAPIALGDGLAIGDQGGRIYSLHDEDGIKVAGLSTGSTGWIGFGRGEIDGTEISHGDTVFKNDDPALNRRLRQSFSSVDPVRRQIVDIEVSAQVGEPLRLTGTLADGTSAEITGDQPLSEARTQPINISVLQEKLGRLGGTPLKLRNLTANIDGQPMVPMGMLNRLRRDLVDLLLDRLRRPRQRMVCKADGARLLEPIDGCYARQNADGDKMHDAAEPPSGEGRNEKQAAKLAILCRNLDQLEQACQREVDLVYADFHGVRQYGDAVRIAREHGIAIGLASVRIQKPAEMGLLKVLGRHRPDWLLARNLAAIDYGRRESIPTIADFSLNVANHRSAAWVRSLGARRITASYDLNRDQLMDLFESVPADWMEVVIHQHMPMFHMEHCVFCNVLSPGTNKTNCGRPCDHHIVQLRDRVGAEHTLQADVACRNTLYNATPQSGAETVAGLLDQGTCWFRLELLNENADQVSKTIDIYRQLLHQQISASQVWRSLQASNRIGVTRGTLEPKRNPLEIL